MNVQKIKILFSSPIGAFIFLIRFTITWLQPDFNVFVPYRGFYFLNRNCKRHEKRRTGSQFSSPIGAFIFLIQTPEEEKKNTFEFSSPIGAFIFLMRKYRYVLDDDVRFSSPIGAFIFLILALQSLYLCGLKRCFAV